MHEVRDVHRCNYMVLIQMRLRFHLAWQEVSNYCIQETRFDRNRARERSAATDDVKRKTTARFM